MTEHPAVNELLVSPTVQALMKTLDGQRDLPVYRLQVPDPAALQREAQRWADALIRDDHDRLEMREYPARWVLRAPAGQRIRAYYPSGYLEYRDLSRTYAGRTSVAEVASAAALCDAFASKHGLWPAGAEREVRVETLRFVRSHGSARDGSAVDVTTHNAIVVYQRLTGGLPWVGPGSKITAMLERDEVVGFNRFWRELLPNSAATVPVVSPEQAIGALVKDLEARRGGAPIERGEILLERADLGYYAGGKRWTQRYLQPVYVFVYHTATPFSTAGFVDVRAAHDGSFEPLGRAPMAALGQPREQKERVATAPTLGA